MDITSANVYFALFLSNMSKLDTFGTALFSNSQFTGGFKVGCSKPIRFLRLIATILSPKKTSKTTFLARSDCDSMVVLPCPPVALFCAIWNSHESKGLT